MYPLYGYFFAANQGLSLDADGVAESQSGAAPTAEGKINVSHFVFDWLYRLYVESHTCNSYKAHLKNLSSIVMTL